MWTHCWTLVQGHVGPTTLNHSLMFLISPFLLFDILSHCLHRNNPKFTSQPAQVPNVPSKLWVLVRRVLNMLWEHGGHSNLRLWTHVSVLHLRPQTQEDVQRLLSHLQKADQRHYQDLPQHIRGGSVSLGAEKSQSQGKKCLSSGIMNSGTII